MFDNFTTSQIVYFAISCVVILACFGNIYYTPRRNRRNKK